MAATPAIYAYTPTQALIHELYDDYRTALMNAKYYAQHLERLKLASLGADILVAIVASAAFASFAIWKSDLGRNVFSVLLGCSAVISALRPVLRLPEKIDRYSKLHYGYLEVFYRIDALTSDMRTAGGVREEHRVKAVDVADRFRALELEGDAYQNASKLLKLQDEVERAIPANQLWLPQE